MCINIFLNIKMLSYSAEVVKVENGNVGEDPYTLSY